MRASVASRWVSVFAVVAGLFAPTVTSRSYSCDCSAEESAYSSAYSQLESATTAAEIIQSEIDYINFQLLDWNTRLQTDTDNVDHYDRLRSFLDPGMSDTVTRPPSTWPSSDVVEFDGYLQFEGYYTAPTSVVDLSPTELQALLDFLKAAADDAEVLMMEDMAQIQALEAELAIANAAAGNAAVVLADALYAYTVALAAYWLCMSSCVP